jgi:integrase
LFNFIQENDLVVVKLIITIDRKTGDRDKTLGVTRRVTRFRKKGGFMRTPVSLFIRDLKAGPVWYVRFLNPSTNRYEATRSTGVQVKGKNRRWQEAYNKALSMADDICFEDYTYLITYLKDFWREDSPYCKYRRLVEDRPLTNKYLDDNQKGVEYYIKSYPPFQQLKISELTAPMVNDWKLWLVERGTGKRRINTLIQTLKTAFAFAYSRDEVPENPLLKISPIRYREKERGVLTVEETEALLTVPEEDLRVKCAILLATFCGLRRGEVRGLQWGDIDMEKGLLNIQHNWVDTEGLKGCKAGSNRQTILHSSIKPILRDLKQFSPHTSDEDYVHFSKERVDEPFSNTIIQKGFMRTLRNIGIDTETKRERNLTFHGLRHSFVTLARMAGLPDIAIMALAGHKSSNMMDRYSHAGQVINFTDAREKLERGCV